MKGRFLIAVIACTLALGACQTTQQLGIDRSARAELVKDASGTCWIAVQSAQTGFSFALPAAVCKYVPTGTYGVSWRLDSANVITVDSVEQRIPAPLPGPSDTASVQGRYQRTSPYGAPDKREESRSSDTSVAYASPPQLDSNAVTGR